MVCAQVGKVSERIIQMIRCRSFVSVGYFVRIFPFPDELLLVVRRPRFPLAEVRLEVAGYVLVWKCWKNVFNR